MAAVMFAQQRDGQPFREDPFEGGEDVLPHIIVSVGHPMFVAQLPGLRPELLLHDMRQLPAVADDDDIPATGAADGRREDIDLRRLVDDDIVEQMPRADRSAQRMGRTQHDRIAFDEGAEKHPVVLHRERGPLLLPRFVQPFVFAVEHIAEQRFRHLPVRFDQALRTLLVGRCPEPGDAGREFGDVGFVELAIGIGGQQLRIREQPLPGPRAAPEQQSGPQSERRPSALPPLGNEMPERQRPPAVDRTEETAVDAPHPRFVQRLFPQQMTVFALGIGAFRPQVGQLRVDAEKLVYGRRQLAQPRSQGRALLRRQPPRGVGHGILLFVCEKGLPPGPVSQFGHQRPVLVFRQFVAHVVHRRIVVGHDTDGFSLHQQIGDDVQNRLRLSRTGRPLDHAHPIAQRPLHGEFLAGVTAEGIDEGRIVDIARRRPPAQIGIQRRTGILRIDALHRLGEQGGDRTFLLPFGNLLCGLRIGLRLQRGFGSENLREIGKQPLFVCGERLRIDRFDPRLLDRRRTQALSGAQPDVFPVVEQRIVRLLQRPVLVDAYLPACGEQGIADHMLLAIAEYPRCAVIDIHIRSGRSQPDDLRRLVDVGVAPLVVYENQSVGHRSGRLSGIKNRFTLTKIVILPRRASPPLPDHSFSHSSRNRLVNSNTCSERAFNSRVQATSVSIWRGSMLRERYVLIALTT